MRTGSALACAAALALAMGGGALVGGAMADDAARPALPLGGARFGMTLDAWKALPPPAGAGPTAAPACWSGAAPVRVPGYAPSAEDQASGVVTCAYLSRFGDDVLPHSLRLDDQYRTSDVRFVFATGRLSELRFHTSVDAYNDVTALLARRFGAPARVERESFRTSVGRRDRVRETWKVGEGRVQLVDPSASDPTELSVDLALSSAAATLAGLGGS